MEIIDEINLLKNAGTFLNYINFIQFPTYKNLEPNTRINFEFPLTVLIGKNGCNKSSVLTALYGTPYGKSTGQFWFSTSTDPIIDGDGNRNRYFYQYIENENSTGKEVLKHRMIRKDDPDYWETSDPVASIGMTDTKRNKPVKKNVVYIDFRGQLSAFDKFFYFGEVKDEKTQDFLRRRSIFVKKAFDGDNPSFSGRNGKKINEEALKSRVVLSESETNCINKILGKTYISIILIEHRFYNNLGSSVLLRTKNNSNEIKYSEANAGSGETAVIQLVHKVMNAPQFSLILLDEPEVSLHPSAQKRIQEFLLNEIKKKKHQIIISSHSPALVKGLPKTAIKLFTTNKDGYYHIQENIDYRMAFFELEEYTIDKKVIICEDIDAKMLIERALRNMKLENHFVVNYAHGGADTLLQHTIPMYAINEEMKKNVFFILDGDKYCKRESPYNFTVNQRMNVDFLEEKVKSIYSNNLPKAYPDGGKDGCREDQKCEIYIQYIDYHYSNVAYLPNNKIPEEIVLNNENIKKEYCHIFDEYELVTAKNAKEILYKIKEENDDGTIIQTFETLSKDLFRAHKLNENTEICQLQDLLRNIFENGNVTPKEECSLSH